MWHVTTITTPHGLLFLHPFLSTPPLLSRLLVWLEATFASFSGSQHHLLPHTFTTTKCRACFLVCWLLFFVSYPTVSSFLRSHRTVSSLFVCLLLWFAWSLLPSPRPQSAELALSSPPPPQVPTHHQCLASIKPRPLPIIHLHTHIYVVGTLWLFLVWCFISGPFGGNTARNCRGQSKTFPLCVESLILVCLPRFYPRFPLQKKSVGTGGGQNGKSYKRQNSSRAIPPTEQHILFRWKDKESICICFWNDNA